MSNLNKLAKKFLKQNIDHLFGCSNEDCEAYWTTVQFLKKEGYSTKPSDLKELMESL